MRYSSTSQLKLQYQITYTEKDTEVSSYIITFKQFLDSFLDSIQFDLLPSKQKEDKDNYRSRSPCYYSSHYENPILF